MYNLALLFFRIFIISNVQVSSRRNFRFVNRSGKVLRVVRLTLLLNSRLFFFFVSPAVMHFRNTRFEFTRILIFFRIIYR